MVIKGSHHTEETKQKMRVAKTDEIRQRISEALKGKKPSKKTREKMSKNHADVSGKNNPMYGKCYSEEEKKKMSLVMKERFKRPEDNPFFGRYHTEETKQRISETLKGNVPWNKGVKGYSTSLKGHCFPEEFKQKIRETRLNRVFPKNDSSIETTMQNELQRRGFKFEKHIPVCGICQPDIVFPELKIAIFADGDYWHSPAFDSGKTWRRDREQDRILKEAGWQVLRFWEHEINSDVIECVDRIKNIIEVDLFE